MPRGTRCGTLRGMQTSRRVLYLPDDLWEKLTAEADRLGTTASFVAREALMVRLEPEVDLPPGFDAMAPGRAPETREQE